MNWILFSTQQPKPSALILVRYSCGGVCVTMFEGTSYKGDQIQYNFNKNGHIFQKMLMRGLEEGVATHLCEVVAPIGFTITEQPTDIID